MWRKKIPGNGQLALAVIFGPDRHALSLAGSMAIANNTFSPMAAGVHTGGTPRGFTGDPGYGVNRFAGRTDPKQNFYGAARPIAQPPTRLLGIGAGVAGQPGLPQTGSDAGGLSSLAYLGYKGIGMRMGS